MSSLAWMVSQVEKKRFRRAATPGPALSLEVNEVVEFSRQEQRAVTYADVMKRFGVGRTTAVRKLSEAQRLGLVRCFAGKSTRPNRFVAV